MAKYVIDIPEEMITSSGELMFHYKNTKDLTYQMYTGINVIPYTEPNEIKNNKVHLCSSCELYKEHFPECGDVNVLFGDGVGNDNVCCCNGYQANIVDRKQIEDEVWEFSERVATANIIDYKSIEKCFGVRFANDIFRRMTYSEAKAKYEAWKSQKDEIRVGDEIAHKKIPYNKAIVTHIDDEGCASFVCNDGKIGFCYKVDEYYKKTGKIFPDIVKLFKE